MNGLALSGGGMKGFAHIGALKELLKIGYEPDIISGTSAGSIVGALYSRGLTPDEIFNLKNRLNFMKLIKFGNLLDGLSSIKSFEKSLNPYLGGVYFKELKKKLIITATNLITGETRFISEGLVIEAVKASSCVPGIFNPVKINNKQYIDGGYSTPTPVRILKERKADKIISITLEHLKPDVKRLNTIKIMSRSIAILRRNLVIKEEEEADLAIRIPTYDYSTFNPNQANKLFELGRKTIIKKTKEIKKLIKK